MSTPVRILIHGAFGRMGQALLRLAAERADCVVVAAVSARSPAQRVIDGVPFFAASELSGVPAFDVAIDFSLPQGFSPILALCIERKAAFVSGTTGLSGAQNADLQAAAEWIPWLWTSNFSFGVAALEDAAERVAALLHGWDCDIVEMHHTQKRDAPSGTALTLGAAVERFGAHPRYASLRAGDIVGEHVVQFAAAGERVELVHRASNRDIFARGALIAATKLAGCPSGIYRLRDLI